MAAVADQDDLSRRVRPSRYIRQVAEAPLHKIARERAQLAHPRLPAPKPGTQFPVVALNHPHLIRRLVVRRRAHYDVVQLPVPDRVTHQVCIGAAPRCRARVRDQIRELRIR